MTVMNVREAINQTLHDAMERDPSVILLGEDVAAQAGMVVPVRPNSEALGSRIQTLNYT